MNATTDNVLMHKNVSLGLRSNKMVENYWVVKL